MLFRSQLGTLYSPPAYVGPYITTANCRFEKNNAVYCHSDRSIYYDPQLLDVQNHTIGDYAAVWIVAHEWGHRVQHLQGKLDPSAGMFSIQKELQADCYAGLYTRDAELRNVAQPGDDELAVTSLRGAHDPLDFPWFENGAHGTTGQRIDALEEGFHGRECDGDAFWRRVHVDPRSAPATAPPVKGPVFTSVACRRGRFGRIELSPSPELIHGEITDAIKTKFRSQDGVIVDLTLLAFRSADAAERAEVAASVAGYVVQKEGPVKEGETLLGKWKLLTGKTEIIVSQSRQTIEIAEAAQGVAWEFMTSPAGAPCKP